MVVCLAGLAVWQWQKNNIDAVVQYTQYSQEELEVQLEQNDQQVQQILEEALETAKAVDARQPPEVAPVQKQPPVKQPMKPEATSQPAQTAEPAGPTYEKQLKVLVDRVYALRDEYVGALEQEAVSAYRAIPAAQRSGKNLIEFAAGYINRATALEKECDGKMDQLVSELEALQKRYGQSNALVEQVKYTYASEKSLKKAWYMSELQSRGMI